MVVSASVADSSSALFFFFFLFRFFTVTIHGCVGFSGRFVFSFVLFLLLFLFLRSFFGLRSCSRTFIQFLFFLFLFFLLGFGFRRTVITAGNCFTFFCVRFGFNLNFNFNIVDWFGLNVIIDVTTAPICWGVFIWLAIFVQKALFDHVFLYRGFWSQSPFSWISVSFHDHSLDFSHNSVVTACHGSGCHLSNCDADGLTLGGANNDFLSHFNAILIT